MIPEELEQKILTHVSQSNYRPVKPRVIAKHLGLTPEYHSEVRRAVKRLVRKGLLLYGPNHLVEPSKKSVEQSSSDQVVGRFQRAQGGFGFVRPLAHKLTKDRSADIYIPEDRTSDAATGDTVLVKIRRRRRGPTMQAQGDVVEIVERKTHQFVGTYFEDNGAGYVEVDGETFRQPIYVGDPGAKNAQADDKVVIEMVRFPTPVRAGEGVITEVLGDHSKPGIDTLLVLREFSLPGPFTEAALEVARAEADRFDESVSHGRRDLTELTVLTIDPVDARDFDDAISLEKLENGNWRLGVHIADVAHFVQANTELDVEAKDRATSIYLPDRVIPMLPEIISNNLASLQPDRVRYTKTAFIEITTDGMPVHTEVCSAAIKSKRRFTYEEVDDFLADRPKWYHKLKKEVFQLLSDMDTLAMILRRRRLDRGAIELNMPEVKLDLDKQGRVIGAHRVEHTESHQIIEEFMLAANEAVATMLADHGIPFLRRIHASPEPRKLKALTEFVRHLGIETESLESRFEIKRVLAEAAGKPEEYAVNFATLRSMQKAVYSPEEEGHYALSSDRYCHFTSPIRRYPDLTVHRLLDKIIRGETPPRDPAHLMLLGDHCSEREQRAELAERELIKLKLLIYMSSRIGTQMEAIVTGVQGFGLFAQGVEIPAEGLVPIEALEDDRYDLDDVTLSLVGRRKGNSFRLGDVIVVEVAQVDLDSRELDFRYVKHIQRHKAPAQASSRRGRSSKTENNGKTKPRAQTGKKRKRRK
jgi:ribonuclease R